MEHLSHCPAKPGMGACRYSSDGGKGEGGRKVLGYVTGDLVEESSGRLRLSYYNGDTCANGRKSVVHVYFQCAAGEGAVSHELQSLFSSSYPAWLYASLSLFLSHPPSLPSHSFSLLSLSPLHSSFSPSPSLSLSFSSLSTSLLLLPFSSPCLLLLPPSSLSPPLSTSSFSSPSPQGVPRLQEDDDTQCETRIEWLTQYACPLDATTSKSWVITNNVTHQVFNLTGLNATLSRTYVEQDGSRYHYTVGLAGHSVKQCGSHTDNVGACQEKLGTNEAHLLGRINNSLQLLGEELRVEYSNGSFCTHVRKPRKAVITFECDSREFLQVLPEVDCEYSFIVHTNLACAKKSVIGVECSVDGFEDLEVFLSLKSPPVPLSNTSSAMAFISVCDPISRDNQENSTALRCPSGAAACIVNGRWVGPCFVVFCTIHSPLHLTPSFFLSFFHCSPPLSPSSLDFFLFNLIFSSSPLLSPFLSPLLSPPFFLLLLLHTQPHRSFG